MSDRLSHVTAKVWKTNKRNFKFPEEIETDVMGSEFANKPNVGITFSGGGTRSAAATLGQLRGLEDANLLKNVKYISAVSGGAWTAVPFIYLPSDIEDNMFLGAVKEPDELTYEELNETEPECFTKSIADSKVALRAASHFLKMAGDETFSRVMGDIFLSDYNLNSLSKFFTYNDASTAKIIEKNPDMKYDDFYRVREGRPFLIAGGTLLRSKNKDLHDRLIHAEFTPLYSGSTVLHEKAGSEKNDIGGGYIETFAMDSDAPKNKPGRNGYVSVRIGSKRHRFTLSDMIGTSSAAPGSFLESHRLDFLGFPEFKHWPLVDMGEVRAKEYTYGDGGNLENLGIMPLLKRGVEKIVVFINTEDELIDKKGGLKINDSLKALFTGMGEPLFHKSSKMFDLNYVFKNEDFKITVDGLFEAKHDISRCGMVFKKTYKIVANRHYGIKGDWESEILWVYNFKPKPWTDDLGDNLKEKLSYKSWWKKRFPYFKTSYQNRPSVVDMSPLQANLLANLTCWVVRKNKALFKEMLG